MDKVLVITGPTASGKTAIAVRLAQILDGEVINADSVQIANSDGGSDRQPACVRDRNRPLRNSAAWSSVEGLTCP